MVREMTRDEPHERFLLVRTGSLNCALPASDVVRVVRRLRCFAVPGSQPHLVGLFDVGPTQHSALGACLSRQSTCHMSRPFSCPIQSPPPPASIHTTPTPTPNHSEPKSWPASSSCRRTLNGTHTDKQKSFMPRPPLRRFPCHWLPGPFRRVVPTVPRAWRPSRPPLRRRRAYQHRFPMSCPSQHFQRPWRCHTPQASRRTVRVRRSS